jgi:hypothetical protein
MEYLTQHVCGVECRLMFLMSGASLLVSGIVIELVTRFG